MDYKKFFSFLTVWRRPYNRRIKFICLVLLSALFTACWYLVYFTGGAKFVYAHAMYVPVLLAAFIFGLKGGLWGGVLAGLVVGPFMPIDTATGEMQTTANWLFRTGFFVLIGVLSGFAVEYFSHVIDHIQWLATHDPVSGIPNQLALQQAVESQELQEKGYYCMILNVDNFIELHYTFGSELGEKLLKKVYEYLVKKFEGLKVFYLLPNRLALLFPDGREWQILASQIYNSLQKESFLIDGIPVFADVSLGVSHYPKDGSCASELLQKAGIALYGAKRLSPPLLAYDKSRDWTRHEDLALLGEISHAMAENQFQLYYQPKVDLRTNRVCGVEALLRWHHPEKGNILPDRFIPQVERSGLVHNVTRWVIKEALRQVAAWQDMGLDIPVSVNISAKNLQDCVFPAFIKHQLKRYSISPEKLELEVTESAIMENPEMARKMIEQLREVGVQVAIDDFGTGYSSLAYLKKLPVQCIKIDRMFIKDLSREKNDQKIVHTSILLARSLGFRVVAEGVEEAVACRMLKEMGCHMGQGYYFGRPDCASQIEELILGGLSGANSTGLLP